MTILAGCLYLLLIVLVGYTLLSVIHPSNRMTIVQLIGLIPPSAREPWVYCCSGCH